MNKLCFNCGKSLLTKEEQEYQEELKKFKTFTRIGCCIDCNDKAVPKTTQWGNYIVSGYAFPQDKEKREQEGNKKCLVVKTPCLSDKEPLHNRIENILLDDNSNENKFERLRTGLKLIALEVERNKIEMEGLISSKIVFVKPEEEMGEDLVE